MLICRNTGKLVKFDSWCVWYSISALDCWSRAKVIDLHQGMIPNKISLISPGCLWPSIALQCTIVAYNTNHLIYCKVIYSTNHYHICNTC